MSLPSVQKLVDTISFRYTPHVFCTAGIECTNLMRDEAAFDAADTIFDGIAGTPLSLIRPSLSVLREQCGCVRFPASEILATFIAL